MRSIRSVSLSIFVKALLCTPSTQKVRLPFLAVGVAEACQRPGLQPFLHAIDLDRAGKPGKHGGSGNVPNAGLVQQYPRPA